MAPSGAPPKPKDLFSITPAPWLLRVIDGESTWRRFCVFAANGVVANIDEGKVADMLGNATLISAAPDLLEALQWAMERAQLHYVRRVPGQNDKFCDGVDRCNAAIAKALGK